MLGLLAFIKMWMQRKSVLLQDIWADVYIDTSRCCLNQDCRFCWGFLIMWPVSQIRGDELLPLGIDRRQMIHQSPPKLTWLSCHLEMILSLWRTIVHKCKNPIRKRAAVIVKFRLRLWIDLWTKWCTYSFYAVLLNYRLRLQKQIGMTWRFGLEVFH